MGYLHDEMLDELKSKPRKSRKPMSKSETPRITLDNLDKFLDESKFVRIDEGVPVVPLESAIRLERELAQAKAEIDSIKAGYEPFGKPECEELKRDKVRLVDLVDSVYFHTHHGNPKLSTALIQVVERLKVAMEESK